MASNEEERETEKFIRPVCCLYNEYMTTLAKFKEEHGVLLNYYNLEDLGDNVSYKLYAEFSKENDGEMALELVQTWICDNHLEVTNCTRIALDNQKQAFCNWFRDSEQHTSPDELLLYCLGKQNNLHVSIFNDKYVWSMLANHIRYDYFEILELSHVILVFLGERHYAIFRKKKELKEDTPTKSNQSSRGRGKGCGHSSSKKKAISRSTGKKSKSAKPAGKSSQTLESVRKERYGIVNKSLAKIDVEKYGRGKRKRDQIIDYQKLNEGDDDIESTPVSPKKAKYIPIRSGPTPHRQSAQNLVTETPRITTLSTVKTKQGSHVALCRALFGYLECAKVSKCPNIKASGCVM